MLALCPSQGPLNHYGGDYGNMAFPPLPCPYLYDVSEWISDSGDMPHMQVICRYNGVPLSRHASAKAPCNNHLNLVTPLQPAGPMLFLVRSLTRNPARVPILQMAQ